MNPKKDKKISRFLSLILRHQPEAIGINLDKNGWTDLDKLIEAFRESGNQIDQDTLLRVVENNDKKRFAISEDGKRIRANQGHSVDVDLGYSPAIPPEILYHGTHLPAVDSIIKNGLDKRKRHHVHLSQDVATAIKVGSRRGGAVVFKVLSGEMQENGHEFFLTENGVWLTEHVDPRYLIKMEYPRL